MKPCSPVCTSSIHLAERALEAGRTCPRRRGEARAGDGGRRLEIEAEGRADVEMLARLEAEVARLTDLLLHDIVVLVGALRHVGDRKVGDRGQRIVQRGLRRPLSPPRSREGGP